MLTFKVYPKSSPNYDLQNTRNVKDAAVSFFHHERLIKHHDLIDMSFERWNPVDHILDTTYTQFSI